MEGNLEQLDLISQLPECLLHHILSFLDFRQIVRACTVSKTWQQAWKTVPILDLSYDMFCGEVFHPIIFVKKRGVHARKLEDFFGYVERTLSARCCEINRLKKLKLGVPLERPEPFASRVELWIRRAVESNVQDLSITLFPRHYYDVENWPWLLPTIFSARSIAILELKNCDLSLPYGKHIRLSTLRKLSLRRVRADDNVIEGLVAGCPEIEDMNFLFCLGFKNLHLNNLPKLKEASIIGTYDLERVKIDASNLDSLCIGGWPKASEVDVAACKNLRSFVVSEVCITARWLLDHLSKFSLLESLTLRCCNELERIRIPSSRLKELEISYCNKLLGVEIDAPHLHSFHYHGRHAISFSLNDALAQPSAYICLKFSNVDTLFDAELIEFVSTFCCSSVVLNLRWELSKFTFPRVSRETLSSPSYNVKALHLGLTSGDHVAIELVDAMLWISPHVRQLTIEAANKFCFEFSYGRQVNEGGNSCCTSVPVACWQHCIKKVVIKSGLDGSEYYFEDNIWENVENFLERAIKSLLRLRQW